jgi:thioredoxin 1
MNNSFKKLIHGDKPVFIDFFATWCGPCKAMEPTISGIASTFKDKVRVIKIDIDKNQELASKLQIRGVPTFMLFDKGELLWRQSGGQSEAGLTQVINSKLQLA